jgi:two-component system, sporulation sensor kinase E
MDNNEEIKQLKSILENISNFIILSDKDGKILYINHTYPNLPIEKVIGSSMYAYIPVGDHDVMKEALGKVFSTGQPTEYQIIGAGPNGSAAWYHSDVTPVKDESGQVTAVVLVSSDVTAKMQTENKLVEAQKIVTDQEVKISQLKQQIDSLQKPAS